MDRQTLEQGLLPLMKQGVDGEVLKDALDHALNEQNHDLAELLMGQGVKADEEAVTKAWLGQVKEWGNHIYGEGASQLLDLYQKAGMGTSGLNDTLDYALGAKIPVLVKMALEKGATADSMVLQQAVKEFKNHPEDKEWGFELLSIALQGGHFFEVEALEDSGIVLDPTSEAIRQMWFEQCRNLSSGSHPDKVKNMLYPFVKAGISAEDKSKAATVAMEEGALEVAEFLLHKDVTVDKELVQKAWFEACKSDNVNEAWLEALLDYTSGAVRRDEGKVALNRALELEHYEMAKFLMGKGFDLDFGSDVGQKAWFHICTRQPFDEECAVDLWSRGMELETENAEGKTALALAFESNNVEVAKFLLDKGAKVNVFDENTRNALIAAFEKQPFDQEYAELLVEGHSEIFGDIKTIANVPRRDKKTPLTAAFEAKNYEAARYLIGAGARFKVDDGGKSIALETGNSQFVELLLDTHEDKEQGLKELLDLSFKLGKEEVMLNLAREERYAQKLSKLLTDDLIAKNPKLEPLAKLRKAQAEFATKLYELAKDSVEDKAALKEAVSQVVLSYDETSDINHLTTLQQGMDRVSTILRETSPVAAFTLRSDMAQKLAPVEHPLRQNFDAAIAEGQKTQVFADLGAHFGNLDTDIVKGGHLRALKRDFDDGQSRICFQFKIGHHSRKTLQQDFEAILPNLTAFEKSLPPMLQGHKCSLDDAQDVFWAVEEGKVVTDINKGYSLGGALAWQLEIEGIGKVVVGASEDFYNLYNDINIELDPSLSGERAFDAVHQMLSMVGLGVVVHEQRADDDEKMKMFLLLRTFQPKLATELENREGFYSMTAGLMRNRIEQLSMNMKEVFHKYLDEQPELMTKQEIYPGRAVWSVSDFGDQVRQRGGWGLMAGLQAHKGVPPKIARILKQGAISSQERFRAGLFVKGASSSEDLQKGGGDQVFTRMITENSWTTTDSYVLAGSVQILYDADVTARGSYCYERDQFGDRKDKELFGERPSLMDLAEKKELYVDNEVMIKERIDPKYIRGVIVHSQEDKDGTIEILRQEGMIELKEGQELVMGKPVEEFVRLSDTFKKEFWGKPIA